MMRRIILGILLILVGCSDPEEQASANLKKGDEFFAKNEYEVAEYYYDKIPEDSPLYRQAQKKLNEIAVVKQETKDSKDKSSESSEVVIVQNQYKTDNTSRVPIHILTLANKSSKKLESVEIEFVYYNSEGSVISTLVGDVKTKLDANSQGVFDKVSPGILMEKFVKCDARVIKAHYR